VETWKTNGLSSYISPEKCRYQVFSNLNFIHPKNENQIGMFNDFHKMGFVIRNIWDIRIIIRSSWIIMIIPKLFFLNRGYRGYLTSTNYGNDHVAMERFACAIYFCHQFVAYPHVFESDSNFSCSNDWYFVFCFHSLVFILYVFFIYVL
jgi:hypothetical protein